MQTSKTQNLFAHRILGHRPNAESVDSEHTSGSTARSFATLPSRSGLTVLELLVVIGLISVLLSLIVPAVMEANRAARRIDCAARIKNVGIAVLGYAENRRSLPNSCVEGHEVTGHLAPRTNWVIEILPWLELASIKDKIVSNEPLDSSVNQSIVSTPITILRCPDDITTTGGNDLSFAVNGGLAQGGLRERGQRTFTADALDASIDLNGDGVFLYPQTNFRKVEENRKLARSLGLFHHARYLPNGKSAVWPFRPRPRSLDSINDGLSNTLMIAENYRTGVDVNKRFSGWASTDTGNVYVAINPRICDKKSCTFANVDLTKCNVKPWKINAGKLYVEGEAPWPNSFHGTAVNIALADGSVRFLSEDTASEVLFDLFTSDSQALLNTPFRR